MAASSLPLRANDLHWAHWFERRRAARNRMQPALERALRHRGLL